MTRLSLVLDEGDERILAELAHETGLLPAEVLRRSLRLLGTTYALHFGIHGVQAPVGDPRDGAGE